MPSSSPSSIICDSSSEICLCIAEIESFSAFCPSARQMYTHAFSMFGTCPEFIVCT